MKFCYRCKKRIVWVQGMVNRFGRLIPMDPWGEPHKHVFPAEGRQ